VIVLRFTTGAADQSGTTQEVRTPRSEVVVGSDPTADVTLQHAGLDAKALKLRHVGDQVHVEMLASGKRITLAVGDEIAIGDLTMTLVELPPREDPNAFVFGGYEDDAELAQPRTFELSEPAGAPPPAIPRADVERPAPAGRSTRSGPGPTRTSQPPPERTRSPAPDAPAKAATQKAPAPKRAPTLTPAEKAALLKPLRFTDPSFGESLVTQLKRAPFFAFSVAFHTLLFLLLSLFDTTLALEPIREGPGALLANLMADEDELGQEVPEIDEDLGLPLPPSDLPDLPEDLPDDERPPPPEVEPPSPFRADMERLDKEVQPVDIGLMPGLRSASARSQRRKPKMPKADLKRTFSKGAAGSSNQRSAEIVRAALGSGRGGNGASLKDLQPEDILVISGSFDHIDKVLDALRLKYVRKSPWALTTPKLIDFSDYKIVFWNCGEAVGKKRLAAVAKRLQKFVRNGGYVFTTDWGVANVLAYAFPGYLKTNGNRAHLPEMVLPIQPAASARDHPLLEGVFRTGVQGKWWLEQASFDVAVGRKDAVTVLIESTMLQTTFNRSPAVAVTFHYGRGRVLHTMGHYYQEAGNLAGTLSAHRLALNFVLMRLDQDREAAARNGR